jgi:riboflavin kinase/FMN adenylyltransferase
MPALRIQHFRELPYPEQPITLAIGAFDGLHRGHADIITHARTDAAEYGGRTGVLRFHPHPLRLLKPEDAPPLLCTEERIQALLSDMGVDIHIRLPFTAERAKQEPEAFLAELHQALPGLRGIVVGPDWRFGHKGRGDIHLLRETAARDGYTVHIRPETQWNGERISSTRIRHAVLRGDLPAAEAMLGRPYRLSGIVQDGKKLGRTLGFPTANFTPGQELLPPAGVYAMTVHAEDRTWMGAGYVTHHPSLVEVHLLDFEGDLYTREIAVDLIAFRRPPMPLPDKRELRRKIDEDVTAIRALLEARA